MKLLFLPVPKSPFSRSRAIGIRRLKPLIFADKVQQLLTNTTNNFSPVLTQPLRKKKDLFSDIGIFSSPITLHPSLFTVTN
jgi:hypothetical protein